MRKKDPMIENMREAVSYFLGGVLDYYGFSRERQMQIRRFLAQQANKRQQQR